MNHTFKIILSLLVALQSCDRNSRSEGEQIEISDSEQVAPISYEENYTTTPTIILENPAPILDGNSIKERFPAPDGFTISDNTSGFGAYLLNLPLKPGKGTVNDYTGSPIYYQDGHVAVVDLEIGYKDLQQCADVCIRLYADYLKTSGREDEIEFHFTSGDLYRWKDHKNGIRPVIQGNNVSFSQQASFNDSNSNFREYLDIIYNYAGSASLYRNLRQSNELEIGDLIINPGFPGHVVFVVNKAVNENGKALYLLAQGFTPAQDIHVLNNPVNSNLSPWYEIETGKPLLTPRYPFEVVNPRRF